MSLVPDQPSQIIGLICLQLSASAGQEFDEYHCRDWYSLSY